MQGNEALGEGAVRAGCQLYAGYPITPQNELTEYMSWRMPEEGRIFIQAESELAAINIVFGAAVAGGRTLTTSSSPGISLMQEGISYLAGCELPAVIVNVVRGGPGLGSIGPAQSDYFQSVKGGGHGDYHCLVLAPSTVQEMMDFPRLAFELAERYRTPALILTDGLLGQMYEDVVPCECVDPNALASPPWALTGCQGREPQLIKSLFLDNDELEALNLRLQEKYAEMKARERRFELFGDEDEPEVLIIAYGSTARVAKSVVLWSQQRGIKLALLRPISLYPFPELELKELAQRAGKLIVVEMSCGQLREDVERICRRDVAFLGRSGGNVVTPEELFELINSLLGPRNKILTKEGENHG